jgi:hypothetical protein
VDPRASLHDVEKRKLLTLSGLKLRVLGHPAHSQSLYQLRYPGSTHNTGTHRNTATPKPEFQFTAQAVQDIHMSATAVS